MMKSTKKKCIKCGKKRQDKNFYTGKNTCKTCILKYNQDYVKQRNKVGKVYQPKESGTKTCSKCLQTKDIKHFPVSKLCTDGRKGQCKMCTNENRKTHYPGYAVTHPKKWKSYNKEYQKRYREDPMNKAKNNLSGRLCNYKIKPQTNICQACNTPAERLFSYFPDKLVYKSIKFILRRDEIENGVQWHCRKCIIKRRDET